MSSNDPISINLWIYVDKATSFFKKKISYSITSKVSKCTSWYKKAKKNNYLRSSINHR